MRSRYCWRWFDKARLSENVELFFLGAGVVASATTGQWGKSLLHAAVTEPIPLTIAVLVFGVIARLLRPTLDHAVARLAQLIGPRWIYFSLIIILGALSSVMTAVIAALILVEAVALLKLDRRSEAAAVVLACFAIGLGAALTPIGEPLGTVAISALNVDFWYLVRLLGPLVLTGILIVAAISLFLPAKYGHSLNADAHVDSWLEIVIRAAKVYLFVAGLVGLSWGLRPLVDEYIRRISEGGLFWMLMGKDEAGTIQTLTACKEVMAGITKRHHGRVVDAPGDNVLAEFASVVDALQWCRRDPDRTEKPQ